MHKKSAHPTLFVHVNFNPKSNAESAQCNVCGVGSILFFIMKKTCNATQTPFYPSKKLFTNFPPLFPSLRLQKCVLQQQSPQPCFPSSQLLQEVLPPPPPPPPTPPPPTRTKTSQRKGERERALNYESTSFSPTFHPFFLFSLFMLQAILLPPFSSLFSSLPHCLGCLDFTTGALKTEISARAFHFCSNVTENDINVFKKMTFDLLYLC